MKRVAFDLEMNQPSNKIIQIGWCIFDENGFETPKQIYVKIEEELNPEIIKLCHIDLNEYQANAVSFELAYLLFRGDCEINQVSKQPVVWGGGDLKLLQKSYNEIIGLNDFYLGRTELNIKNIHQAFMESKGLKTQGGLAKSMTKWGLNFAGTKHQAHWDAYNTARLYIKMLEKLKCL